MPHPLTKNEAASMKKPYQMVLKHYASFAPVRITDDAVQHTIACTANLHSIAATKRVAHCYATIIF